MRRLFVLHFWLFFFGFLFIIFRQDTRYILDSTVSDGMSYVHVAPFLVMIALSLGAFWEREKGSICQSLLNAHGVACKGGWEARNGGAAVGDWGQASEGAGREQRGFFWIEGGGGGRGREEGIMDWIGLDPNGGCLLLQRDEVLPPSTQFWVRNGQRQTNDEK